MGTDYTTGLTMPPTSLTSSQHGKHKEGHERDEGKKTRTKKRRESSVPLPAETGFPLLCVLFLS